MHEIIQAAHHLHHRFIEQAGYSLNKAATKMVLKILEPMVEKKGAYTYQSCFNDCFIFRLPNSQFLPRLVPLQEHVGKLTVDTIIEINGIRLVRKYLEVFSPNYLITK